MKMLEISYLYRNYKAVLAVVSVVLFITSLIVHEYENWPIYRGLRGVASFAFLGLLLLFNLRKINYYLVGFLFFYIKTGYRLFFLAEPKKPTTLNIKLSFYTGNT